MGKKSIKEDKNIYQLYREALDYTRAEASDKLEYISASRLEKIENEKSGIKPYPEEILRMADVYKRPELCNYYCTHECEIGQKYVPEITDKSLPEIVLEMISLLNKLNEEKNELIDITVDSAIDESELRRFVELEYNLSKMASTIEHLKFWVSKSVSTGSIDKEKLESLRELVKKGH